MCEYRPDEVCTVWRESFPRARVARWCHCCATVIHPGDVYLRINGVSDHRGFTDWLCIDCAWAKWLFGQEHSYWPATVELWDALVDCSRESENGDVWSELAAGMRARRDGSPETLPETPHG